MKLTLAFIISLCLYMMLQVQLSKTVNITAGSLSTVLTTEEKNTITSLTLTGTIDARDFKTMRDDMPSLNEVDLSEVNILEYSRAEDPAGSNNVTYTENTMFKRAYFNKPRLNFIQFTESVAAIQGCYLSDNWLIKITIPHIVNTISN